MSKRPNIPNPLPEEDLGRGGDAASGFPAGPSGEREEIARDLVKQPSSSPRQPEPPPPPSATN